MKDDKFPLTGAGTKLKAGTPFRRAKEMFAKLAIIARLSDESLRRKAIVDLGPYESRGKGKSRSKPGKTYRSTNKFLP